MCFNFMLLVVIVVLLFLIRYMKPGEPQTRYSSERDIAIGEHSLFRVQLCYGKMSNSGLDVCLSVLMHVQFMVNLVYLKNSIYSI